VACRGAHSIATRRNLSRWLRGSRAKALELRSLLESLRGKYYVTVRLLYIGTRTTSYAEGLLRRVCMGYLSPPELSSASGAGVKE
jgi:hypothetical protein